MPTTRSGKRTRVPWKPDSQAPNTTATLPVFVALCGVAASLEAGLGMGHTFVVERHQRGHFERLRTFNPELRKHVHDVSQRELERARSVIQTRRAALNAIVARLMEAGAMTGDEVQEIVQRHRRSIVSLAKTWRAT